MKKLLLILNAFALTAILLFSASCSDNSTSNPVTPTDTTKTTGDYFKIATGNYWTYTQYDRDQANAKVLASKRADSIVIDQSLTMFGKTGFKMTHFKNTEPYTYYAYTENSCLYMDVLSLLPSTSTIPIPVSAITNQWVKVADMNATSKWQIFTQAFSNIDVPVTTGVTGKLSATYTASVEKKSASSTTINGKVVTTQEFQTTHNIKGTLSVTFGIPLSIPIDINIITHDVYGKDLGKISTWTESTKLDFSLGTFTQTIPINGSEAYIEKYSVK